MKTPPFISIVIPTYNSAGYIDKCLESVFFQTYNNYEIIVADDGSVDNTVNLVEKRFNESPLANKNLLFNKHRGLSATLNIAIQKARGEWISFLDSDDFWFHDKLKKSINYIESNKDVIILTHSLVIVDGKNKKIFNPASKYNKKKSLFLNIYRQNVFLKPAVIIRRRNLLDLGPFSEDKLILEDYDMWLRLALRYPKIIVGFIEEPLGVCNIRTGGESSNIEQMIWRISETRRRIFESARSSIGLSYIEKIKADGRLYFLDGLKMMEKGFWKKGLFYFVNGILKWPFVFEWFPEIFMKVIKRFFPNPRVKKYIQHLDAGKL